MKATFRLFYFFRIFFTLSLIFAISSCSMNSPDGSITLSISNPSRAGEALSGKKLYYSVYVTGFSTPFEGTVTGGTATTLTIDNLTVGETVTLYIAVIYDESSTYATYTGTKSVKIGRGFNTVDVGLKAQEDSGTFDYPYKATGGYKGYFSLSTYGAEDEWSENIEDYVLVLKKCSFTYTRMKAGQALAPASNAVVYVWTTKGTDAYAAIIAIPNIPNDEGVKISNVTLSSWDGSETHSYRLGDDSRDTIINNGTSANSTYIYFFKSN